MSSQRFSVPGDGGDDAEALDHVDVGRQPRPAGRLAQRERHAAVGDVVREREQMRVTPDERDEPCAEPAQQDDAVAAAASGRGCA